MARQGTWLYRFNNILLALLVFVTMIFLPSIMSGVVLGVIEGMALNSGGEAALSDAYAFLVRNLNLFSAVVYVLFGTPIFLWLRGMRRRGRKAEQALREAEALQAAGTAPTAGLPQTSFASQALVAQQGVPQAATAPQMTASLQGVPQVATAPQVAPAPQVATAPQTPSLPEQVSFRIRTLPRFVWLDSVLMGIGLQFTTLIVMIAIIILLPTAMEEYEALVEDSGLVDYGIMWFIATIVLPPLVEETGFRGLGLTYLKRAGVPFAVANVLQALAFGIFHMNLTQGIYTFVFGLFIGYVAHATGSIVPAMLVHAIYNFMGTIGGDMLYAIAPWLPVWFEIVVGLLLVSLAMLSLHDRGRRCRGAVTPDS